MSITTEINRIKTAKQNLMTAINNKGGSLTENSKLEDFVTSVEEDILTGGSVEIPSGICFAYSTWTTVPLFVLDYMETLTSIPNKFLSGCSNLTSITIPNSVTSIGNNCFYECTALTSITISSLVTRLGDLTFYKCSALTSITIPNSVTTIGGGCFQSCSGLTSITLPSKLSTLGSSALSFCTALTSITIPKVFSIESYAFQGCTNLTSITIPSNVYEMKNSLFDRCPNLVSITIEKTTPPQISAYTFNGWSSGTIYVPAGSVDAYKAATNWSSYASRIQAIPTENE